MKQPLWDGVGMTSLRARDQLVALLRREGIGNEAVLARIREVPRHLFVDEALASRAYENTALPIGHGQTISQPYVVALMTSALIAGATSAAQFGRVLEVGMGCAYQTAVLAPFVQHIYGLERINALLCRGRENLRALRISNVSSRHSDGWHGWRSQAPFQGMIVAAAGPEVSPQLLEQLDDGGRLILPVGAPGHQTLMRITRVGNHFRREELAPASFVPLLGGIEA